MAAKDVVLCLFALAALAATTLVTPAARADQLSFHALYKGLVETDTTLASGDCTLAAGKVAKAMLAAGFPKRDVRPYAAEGHPKEGGLVAVLKGSDPKTPAVLLVAHIDVVDANPADWSTDPFKLVESDGYFRGRGVSDDKAMAASLIDSLILMHQEGFRPRRDIKVALTCGEETASAFNGAQYLANQRRDLVEAGMVLVPSGGGALDGNGRAVSLIIQAGEKVQQNFRLEASGISTHASRPTKDNAIYILSRALLRVDAHTFPVQLNEVTRLYFTETAATADPHDRVAISNLLVNPDDLTAQAQLTANPAWNGYLRTTCVATVVETGTQTNTVAQRARANINCRLLPGTSVPEVQAVLNRVVADPAVTVTALPPVGPTPPSPPITPQVLGPIQAAAYTVWPGVRVIPAMLTGATDARHFNAAGIPAYGLTAVFSDPDGGGVHAANERVRVSAVYRGREFIYRLMKVYGQASP